MPAETPARNAKDAYDLQGDLNPVGPEGFIV